MRLIYFLFLAYEIRARSLSDWFKDTFTTVKESVIDPVQNFVEDDFVSFVKNKVVPLGENDVFGENDVLENGVKKKVAEPVSEFVEEKIAPEGTSAISSIQSWVNTLFG